MKSDRALFCPDSRDLILFMLALIVGLFLASLREGIVPILIWVASMPFHEVGHALIYWLSGKAAIPSFGVTITLNEDRSIFVFATVFALSCFSMNRAKRGGYPALFIIALVTTCLSPIFTFIISPRTAEILALYGGLGGEIYLSVIALLLFFQPMPAKLNWGKNRFLFLIIGALSFSGSILRWYHAQASTSELPMGALFDFGALFGDGTESSGDLDRLIREYGWSTQFIVNVYSVTTLTLVAVLIIYYVTLLHLYFTHDSVPS